MGFHTFDPDRADALDDDARFRFCSREELLAPLPDGGTILDLGSGVGFYTDELVTVADRILAVDVQPVMHRRYRERGVPDAVELLTADAGSLPLAESAVDGAVSTMTFHESTTEASLAELGRVLDTDTPFVVVDWSRAGRGADGPPVEERFDADRARDLLTDAGFDVETATERPETFAIVGRA